MTFKTTAAAFGRRLIVALVLFAAPAQAQSRAPMPDEAGRARLVWSAMVALDHANRTGNYSVLHALGSPGFQQRNSVAALADLFKRLRERRVDVGRAVLASPRFHIPPEIDQDGVLRLRGSFDFRPKALGFDLLFEWAPGWQLLGISVVEKKTTP